MSVVVTKSVPPGVTVVGNPALTLVSDLAGDWLFLQKGKFKSGTVFVAPHAKEASGDNAILQTLSTQGAVSR